MATERPILASLCDPRASTELTVPDEEAVVIAERVADWFDHFQPGDEHEAWCVEQAAVESVRIERYQRQEHELRAQLARRARLCWDHDHRIAAEILFRKLPKNPALVARQIQRTPQGCACLLERWEGLGRALDLRGAWTDAQRNLALDLLGIAPDLRDMPTVLDATPGEGEKDVRQRVAREEIERLTHWQEELSGLDACEQAAAERGEGLEGDRALALIRRNERASERRQQWALRQLQKARRPPPRMPAAPPRPHPEEPHRLTPQPEDSIVPRAEPDSFPDGSRAPLSPASRHRPSPAGFTVPPERGEFLVDEATPQEVPRDRFSRALI